jgi:pheromone receptor transcription factor
VLLLVVSETGLVYTFTTPKLQPLVTKPEGKNLIQVRCTASPAHRIANPCRPA